MKATKWVSTAVALTLMGSVAIGCAKSEESPSTSPTGDTKGTAAPASNKPQELKINFTAEPPVMDSSKTTANAAFTFLGAFNEGLYRTDKDGKASPALAKDFPKISADGLTYTFDIRDNANWSDGQPVKAQDFVYSFKRTLDPNTKAQYSFIVAWIKGGEAVTKAKTPDEIKAAQDALGVKAINDKQLEIKLEKPVAFFTQLLAFATFFPQREDFVTKTGDKYGAEVDKVIGAGPFVLSKWDHGQTLELVKNDKYWDAANVKLTKVTANIVKDSNTGLNLYETDAADLTEINRDQLKLYKGKPDNLPKPELTNSYLMYQTKKVPALGNKKIRQALGLAIDRQAYVDTVLANGSVASTGLVPGGTSDGAGGDFRKSAGETQPKFDAAKAKQLLAEGLKELGLTELPKMKVNADDTETAKKSLEFILAQWKQNLGYDAVANPVPHALRIELSSKKDFDIVLSLWGADYNDPMTFLDMWVSGGEFDEGDYSNPEYDKLIKSAQTEVDASKRSKALIDAEKILMDDQGVAPLYFRTRAYLKKENVTGLILPAFGQEWELKWATIK
ncbi:peptide ABC transporter substrate-binding protein [Paenibacillus marchantiophytorum]|uniref:Peptide ABC transporter substrate-binding protein n=1 Tax=Paenibacillus marchantiophytorum TaxID=1619310 RepID=A0ABQ2BRP5_9BACL|nr:peptide ABC transporter substrate-binding protein [Paenibacillus marchantiophytorum]GGI43358.1 peptide ABC transporter substrate-binding protein [Paenibacillus marchantiophytorum]